jgi:hypothetical protein
MMIEQLWLELEAEAAAGSSAAWLTRFARPQPGPALLVALEQNSGRRALLLPVSKPLLPPRRDWPECRGLEMFTVALNGLPHLGVRLRDKNSADVFTALAEDVAPRVSAATGMKAAVAALLSRLSCWQRFLAAMKDGLSLEAQRGLFGELHVLKTHLLPEFGTVDAIESWKAAAAAHQDFQFASGALEVKTTAAKQPQAVRITSERQLDDTGVGALFLHVVAVDEREVASAPKIPGTLLPDLITILRAALTPDISALLRFNERLLDAGYLDFHASRYENRRYTVRREWTFRVTGKFPRIVERELPEGIGEVNYALSLGACEPFAVEKTTFINALKTPTPTKKRKNP